MDREHKKLESNIWKYALILVANKRIFAAILSVYYLTIPDVTASWIGMFILIGSLAGFVFEVPSGYFSDKIGHKTALVISRAATLLSTLFFLLADSILLLVLGTIFLSIGSAFISGTGSAFMHETLRALGRENEYTKIIGKITAIGFAVPILLTAVIPFSIAISFKIPFLIALVIDCIGVCAALTLVKPHVPQERIDEIDVKRFSDVIREGMEQKFFRYALFSGIVFGALFTTGIFRGPYQESLGILVIWFGVLHGIGRVGASLLLAYSGKLRELIGNIHRFQTTQITVYGLLYVVLALSTTWWVVASAFIVLNAFQWGMSKVEEGYLLDMVRNSNFKATLLSLKALIGELATAVIGFGMGVLVQWYGFQIGFGALGVCFVVLLVTLQLYIGNRKHSL
jgi:MFS family permease